MKCNQSRPEFELVSPCSFPTTITITPRAPPISNSLTMNEKWYYLRGVSDHGSFQFPVSVNLSWLWRDGVSRCHLHSLDSEFLFLRQVANHQNKRLNQPCFSLTWKKWIHVFPKKQQRPDFELGLPLLFSSPKTIMPHQIYIYLPASWPSRLIGRHWCFKRHSQRKGYTEGDLIGDLNSDTAACVSLHANTLRKGMNRYVLLLALGK